MEKFDGFSDVHNSILHNSQFVDTPQMPINGRRNMHIVYAYNEILFRYIKERHTDNNLQSTWILKMLHKVKEARHKRSPVVGVSHIYETSRIG